MRLADAVRPVEIPRRGEILNDCLPCSLHHWPQISVILVAEPSAFGSSQWHCDWRGGGSAVGIPAACLTQRMFFVKRWRKTANPTGASHDARGVGSTLIISAIRDNRIGPACFRAHFSHVHIVCTFMSSSSDGIGWPQKVFT